MRSCLQPPSFDRYCAMYVSIVGGFLICVTLFACCCWTKEETVRVRSQRSLHMAKHESDDADLQPAIITAAAAASAEHRNVSMTTTPASVTRQTRPFQILHPKLPDVPIECIALRSKRYISDGFCTSLKPVSDVVCTGSCLPIRDLPWYAEFIKVWSRQKTLQYRCVDDLVRVRKVTFVCQNGETRTYDIRVVRSCKCKRYLRGQNDSTSSKSNKKNNKKNKRND